MLLLATFQWRASHLKHWKVGEKNESSWSIVGSIRRAHMDFGQVSINWWWLLWRNWKHSGRAMLVSATQRVEALCCHLVASSIDSNTNSTHLFLFYFFWSIFVFILIPFKFKWLKGSFFLSHSLRSQYKQPKILFTFLTQTIHRQ